MNYPDFYEEIEYAMKAYMVIAFVAYFWQWREQLNIYVEEKYIRPVEILIAERVKKPQSHSRENGDSTFSQRLARINERINGDDDDEERDPSIVSNSNDLHFKYGKSFDINERLTNTFGENNALDDREIHMELRSKLKDSSSKQRLSIIFNI